MSQNNVTLLSLKCRSEKLPMLRSAFYAILFTLSVVCTNSIDAQWIQTNGPYGGNGSDFIEIGNLIFSLSSNGVFRSIDTGRTWIGMNNGLTNSYNACLLSTDKYLYVGTQDS